MIDDDNDEEDDADEAWTILLEEVLVVVFGIAIVKERHVTSIVVVAMVLC